MAKLPFKKIAISVFASIIITGIITIMFIGFENIKSIAITYAIIQTLLLLLTFNIFQVVANTFSTKTSFKRTDEEMVDVLKYVQKWWKEKLETGEDFIVEESEAYEIYIGTQRYYAISITRRGTATKMFVLVATNPIRISYYMPYSSIYYQNPIEVIKDVFGVVPTPAPSQQPIFSKKSFKKKVIKEEPEDEDEILKKELSEVEKND